MSNSLNIVAHDLAEACRRVAPLWELPDYVAVNPFLGFSSRPIVEATRIIEAGLDASVLPPLDYYRTRRTEGLLTDDRINAAAERCSVDPAEVREALASAPTSWSEAPPMLTCAQRHDLAHGTDWQGHLIRSLTRWCAVYATDAAGDSAWGVRNERGFFAAWHEEASVDRSLEVLGLHGWRAWVRALPEDPTEAAALAFGRINLPPERRVDYLYRLLGGVLGWASLFRRPTWVAGTTDSGPAGELLVAALCADAAVAALDESLANAHSSPTVRIENETVRLTLQEAVEDHYTAELVGALRDAPAAAIRPAVQAVFCIDVRSEVLRRHLEAQSERIETKGFAGFFGVSADVQGPAGGSARCPVLLRPSVPVQLAGAKSRPTGATLKRLAQAPASAFSLVEVLGLAYGLKLAANASTLVKSRVDAEVAAAFTFDAGDLRQRVTLAAGILKNLGFGDRIAPIVLLCGHGGRSANNPHAAGLHCGACGGHGGAINARIAAALLNDPAVRAELRATGITLPHDVHFLPAAHDTSSDQVTLLDLERVPAEHGKAIGELRGCLAAAGAEARRERGLSLGLGDAPPSRLERILRRRARDWSEVRPEWALARNAAFIAARRSRTRGIDLGGRAFLHDYDSDLDPDSSVLSLILSAPMVVASWINLQYFASTVDNDTFGCGDKTLHNRVGRTGVVLGNGGDLRTGLAKQSVHAADGSWYHEPLRLQVIVEAEPDAVDAVLAEQAAVTDLVRHGWVRLFSLDRDKASVRRCVRIGSWTSMRVGDGR